MKTIYDETLDILVDSFTDPQDEENDSYMFNRRQMDKISKAIRKAQKQEKLLKLYREKDKYVVVFTPLRYVELDKYRNIVKQIKELESETIQY